MVNFRVYVSVCVEGGRGWGGGIGVFGPFINHLKAPELSPKSSFTFLKVFSLVLKKSLPVTISLYFVRFSPFYYHLLLITYWVVNHGDKSSMIVWNVVRSDCRNLRWSKSFSYVLLHKIQNKLLFQPLKGSRIISQGIYSIFSPHYKWF